MEAPKPKTPISVLVVGLAGSGKSTLVHGLNEFTYNNKINSYYVNLDPATSDLNFSANIDIRDTVKYDDVMKQFSLGPNGAILTSLNLFSTKFHDVISIIQKREGLKFAFFDTPGQIEAFAWSASGGMITQELASVFPTVILFVVDIPRCSRTATFVSTMLYACSILYRSGLPIVLALTKTDVKPADEIIQWMTDNDKFEEAIDNEHESTYFDDFNKSCGSVFSEFYQALPVVPVSGVNGEGIDKLLEAIEKVAYDKPQTNQTK
ncbi:putative XPA-interacting protein [Histomonas meleagridis]|uniref:putative XPA-interacting protein n=1 Tax=Histomonas meleagridis TaxID=135588 RepID=UPI00355AAAE1|nr:putative XPA-interacting protein [Histomonas meleagridis]KAH0802686.1 putative XPA-interacting protein [Histomonas meleagridis]